MAAARWAAVAPSTARRFPPVRVHAAARPSGRRELRLRGRAPVAPHGGTRCRARRTKMPEKLIRLVKEHLRLFSIQDW